MKTPCLPALSVECFKLLQIFRSPLGTLGLTSFKQSLRGVGSIEEGLKIHLQCSRSANCKEKRSDNFAYRTRGEGGGQIELQ